MKKKRRTVLLLTFYLAYLVLVLVLGELLFRLLLSPNQYQSSFSPHPSLVWTRTPGMTYGSNFSVNNLGFRDSNHNIRKPADVVRIAFIGDSYTEGSYVAQDKRFSNRFGSWGGGYPSSIETFNFGIAAYGTDQEYLLLKNIALDYAPDIVIVIVVPNDFRESYMKSLFSMKDGLLVFHAEDPALHPPFVRLALWRLAELSKLFFALQGIIGKHYGTFEGVVGLTNGLFFKESQGLVADEVLFLSNRTEEMKNATLLMSALLNEMDSLCKMNNCTLVVVNLPIKDQFNRALDSPLFDKGTIQGILSNITSSGGIAFLDLYPLMNQTEAPLDYYLEDDFHLSEKGHAFVGHTIYEFLVNSSLLTSPIPT